MSGINFKSKAWTRRLEFSALAGWLIMSLALAVTAYLGHGVDFRGYYAAARVLLAGGNPYDYKLVAQELLNITGKMGNNPYYYPPWFVWLFVPLTAFQFQTARAVWLVINVVIWNVSLWQLGVIFNWPDIVWRRYILFALATFSFAWITWRYEQAGILVFAILIATIISIQSQKWVWVGIWMALLLIKPNITAIVVAGISLWLIRKGNWRPIGIMALTLFTLLAISTLITPAWYQPFFEDGFGQGLQVVLDGADRVVALRINTTFLDWLATLNIVHGLRVYLYGGILLAGVIVFFLAVFRSNNILQLISILLLVSYALTPYALQYDYPSLVVVLFWGLSLCALQSPKAFWIGILLSGFVFSVIFWQQNISSAYWMVVGLGVLGAWGMYQENKTALVRGSL
jgi:hypothetical protein